MDIEKLKCEYLPMTETSYYILLSLTNVMHGYGIMKNVEKITCGRIRISAGTLYGSISRMEKSGLIVAIAEETRRKLYQVTDLGCLLLKFEIERLYELYDNGKKYLSELSATEI